MSILLFPINLNVSNQAKFWVNKLSFHAVFEKFSFYFALKNFKGVHIRMDFS